MSQKAFELWHKLNASVSSTVRDTRIKEAAKSALKAAEESIQAHRPKDTIAYLTVASYLLDALMGVDPVTGFIRDTADFFTGMDSLTHEQLSLWERSLLGFSVASSLYSFGVVSSVRAAWRISARILSQIKETHQMKGFVEWNRRLLRKLPLLNRPHESSVLLKNQGLRRAESLWRNQGLITELSHSGQNFGECKAA